MTTPTTTPETVAEKFLTALREEIGAANYRTVCERNAAEPDGLICHSHDFCDANMVMLAVLTELGFDEDLVVSQDDAALVSLWNTGWNLAFDQMAREGAQPLRQRDVVPDPSEVVEPDLNVIAGHLKALGIASVTVEYPGCVCVWAEDLILQPDAGWWFGTANATWMGDLQTADGRHLGHLETRVSSNETDPLVIAKAIAEVLHNPPADSLDSATLIDLLERTVSIMETTHTDNPGETVAEGHPELYRELKRALKLKGGAR